MPIKVFCDLCDKECNDMSFMCEILVVDTFSKLENVPIQKKDKLFVCKTCYESKLKNILYVSQITKPIKTK